MQQSVLKRLAEASSYEVVNNNPGSKNLIITGELKRKLDTALENTDTAALDNVFEKVKELCKVKATDLEERKKEVVANPFAFWELVFSLAGRVGNAKIKRYAFEKTLDKVSILVDGQDLKTIYSAVEKILNEPPPVKRKR